MVFPLKNRGRRLLFVFSAFKIVGVFLPLILQFNYLGHIIASDMYDETRYMFIKTNVFACKLCICSKFSNCSFNSVLPISHY